MIVEHYTASTSFSSAWNTFASDAPDAELGEKPGTCAHFVIDHDGIVRLAVVGKLFPSDQMLELMKFATGTIE